MIVRTSYWTKENKKGYENCLAVSVGVPKDFKGERLQDVMPTWAMVKKGYTKVEYFDLLESRGCDPEKILQKCSGRILCCWESDPSECHRLMLIEWLKIKVESKYIPEETIPSKDRAEYKSS